MSVDGRVCSVGSANLDITAGYWENELMLVVEDPTIAARARGAHRSADRAARSASIATTRPGSRPRRRRDWMRHWPGVLSV